MSLEFYDELLKSKRFCESLGRLLLMSGKLESALKSIVLANSIKVVYNLKRAMLGQLIRSCKEHELVTDELNEVLKFILDRRNYLTHNLYPLFNDEIEYTLLPKDNLDSDDAESYFPKCVEDLIADIQFAIDYINERN